MAGDSALLTGGKRMDYDNYNIRKIIEKSQLNVNYDCFNSSFELFFNIWKFIEL